MAPPCSSESIAALERKRDELLRQAADNEGEVAKILEQNKENLLPHYNHKSTQ